MSSIWMWFQATAIGPVAAGAAIGMTVRTASGRVSATSSATMPPSEPPTTRSSRVDAERVEEPPLGARLVAGRDRRERRAVRPPGPRVGRGRAGRAVAAAEQVGAQDAEPVRVERPARPDERLPPVAGRVGRAGQGVDDEDLRRVRRAPGRRAGRRRSGPAGACRRRARTARARPFRGGRSRSGDGPSRLGTPSREVPRSGLGSSGRADELAVGRRLGGRGGERLLEVGDEVVDVLEADRQPDEVRRRRRSRSAPPARAASGSSTPDG